MQIEHSMDLRNANMYTSVDEWFLPKYQEESLASLS